MERIILRMLRHKLGELPQTSEQRIKAMSGERIEELSDALPAMSSTAELEAWLANATSH